MKKHRLIMALVLAFVVFTAALVACANPVIESRSVNDSGVDESVYTGTQNNYKVYTLTIQMTKGRAMPEANNDYVLTVNGLDSHVSTGTIKSFTPGITYTFVLQPGVAGTTEFTVLTKDTVITHIRGAITYDDGTKVSEPGSFSAVYIPPYNPGGSIPSADNTRITAPASPVKNGIIIITAADGSTKVLTYNDSSSAFFAFMVTGTGNAATATVKKKDNASFTQTLEIPALFKDGDNYYPVASIANSAFAGVTAITSVIIPSTVMAIGDNAFDSCTGLISVIIEDADSAGNARIVATIPTGIRSIGNDAFTGCVSLTTIIIYARTPPTLGRNGLPDGSTLTSIYVPAMSVNMYKAAPGWSRYADIIKAIGSDDPGSDHFHIWGAWVESEDSGNHLITRTCSFSRPSHSETYTFYDPSRDTGLQFSSDDIEETASVGADIAILGYITIPDYYKYNNVYYRVTALSNRAFYDCVGLTGITIPQSVMTIGESAFHYCTSLTSVTIPSNVTSMGNYTFSGCSNLTTVTISAGVTFIGDNAFSNCINLTTITIPSSVTSIGADAFYRCTGLTTVTIPTGVLSIGDWAFQCTGLTDITIPDSVTFIGNCAFYECTDLTTVTIGAGVMSIGDQAFSYCISLTTVACNPTTPPVLGAGVFDFTHASLQIKVPVASVAAYQVADGWSYYVSRISAQ